MIEKYLITGFSGFVSRHFCDYLERKKVETFVKGIDVQDHYLNFNAYRYVSFDFEKVDLLSVKEIERVLAVPTLSKNTREILENNLK